MRPDFPLSLRNPLLLTEILADFTDTGRVTLFCDLVEGTLWLANEGEIRPTRPNLQKNKEEHHEENSQGGVDRDVGDRIICRRYSSRAAAYFACRSSLGSGQYSA